MKKSQRQMILIGLCGLGLVAVVYDRLTTNSPAVAQADSIASTPATGAAGAVDADDSAATPLTMPCQAVKETLQKALGGAGHDSAALADGTSPRDVFCPSEAWLPKVAQAAAPKGPEHANGEAFLQSHKLQAVLLSDGSPSVIVNDKSLRIGQEIDGFKLIRVENGRAIFASLADDCPAVELVQNPHVMPK
jgi:hypothetical protein